MAFETDFSKLVVGRKEKRHLLISRIARARGSRDQKEKFQTQLNTNLSKYHPPSGTNGIIVYSYLRYCCAGFFAAFAESNKVDQIYARRPIFHIAFHPSKKMAKNILLLGSLFMFFLIPYKMYIKGIDGMSPTQCSNRECNMKKNSGKYLTCSQSTKRPNNVYQYHIKTIQ